MCCHNHFPFFLTFVLSLSVRLFKELLQKYDFFPYEARNSRIILVRIFQNVRKYNGTLKLDYINIPILANVYVVKGLALKAGIQPGFCINKKVSIGGVSVDIDEAFKQADTNYKINTVDFSIPIGLSYEYNGLIIDARYNLGVTKVASGYVENEGIKMRSDDRHSVFQITLGYKFQL